MRIIQNLQELLVLVSKVLEICRNYWYLSPKSGNLTGQKTHVIFSKFPVNPAGQKTHVFGTAADCASVIDPRPPPQTIAGRSSPGILVLQLRPLVPGDSRSIIERARKVANRWPCSPIWSDK